MQAEIALTIKLHQRLFADPRRITLLKHIQSTGSISQGAKQAGISYKSGWDAINEMNQLADKTLVERATGGKGGGGARLTHYGERLIQLYDLLEQIQQKAFDTLQDDNLPLDSLLAAIARFSLQTSARNQLFATVVKRQQESIKQDIELLLTNGKTRIVAAVTRQSAERLGLHEGKEVLALIKAPWITLRPQISREMEFDNQLPVTISNIERGTEFSEILLSLADGQPLCATLANHEIPPQWLAIGQPVIACFNADRVIIASLC